MTVALAALALALPAALFVAWPLLRRRGGSLPSPDDETRTALEAEKLLALRTLRELTLEREAGLLSEGDYAELRLRYEARAAAVLKRLDALPPVASPAPARARRPAPAAAAAATAAPPTPVSRARRPLLLTGGALGILVFGVVLGVLVVRYTSPTPPDPMAAVPGPSAIPEPDVPGPSGEAGGAKALPPGMLEGMLKAAHQALDAGQYQQAISAYKAILKRESRNVDAITHLGIILAVAGHADGALEAFDRALAIQPDYPHALWDKARVLYEQRQDYAGAIATWERFVAVTAPGSDHEQARALIREAKAKLAAAPAAAAPAPKPAGSSP